MSSKVKSSSLTPKDLNLKLADLEDQGLLAFRDALLDPSFKFISELGLVNELVQLFRAFGCEEELLVWAIRSEMQTTDKAADLFRMQSFATQLLFKFFFDESSGGMRYMKRTVWRVIDAIADMTEEQLELEPNGVTVSVREATRNLEFILDVADDLFTVLIAEVAYCPTVIRKGFLAMKREAKAKFPDVEDKVVPACFFLRFLSPTLVQPDVFGVMQTKPNPHIFKALLIVSKLVQNIANGIAKNNITSYVPHDEVILKFIQKHVASVKEVGDALAVLLLFVLGRAHLCSDFAKLYFLVMPSSFQLLNFRPTMLVPRSTGKNPDKIEEHAKFMPPPPKASEQIKEEILDRVHHFVLQGQYRLMLDRLENEQLSHENMEQKRVGSASDFIASISGHIRDLEWKKIREKHSISIYALKKTLFWYHLQGRAKASLEQTKHVIHNLDFREWMQDVFGEKIVVWEKCLLVDRMESMKELWSIRFKFPFPYGTRLATVERIFYQMSPTEYAMLLLPYRPSDGQKTNTNATFDAAYFFKEDKDKTTVEISVFYALNPEGAFPPAVNVAMAKPFLGGIFALKELILSGGKSNTRRSRRTNRGNEDEAPFVTTSVDDKGGKRGRRRAQSDSNAGSPQDEEEVHHRETKGRPEHVALKRLKSLSKLKKLTRKEIQLEKETETKPRLSALSLSHSGNILDEDVSLDYDLYSDSDEEKMKLIDKKNELTRAKRSALRNRSGSISNELDESLDLLSDEED